VPGILRRLILIITLFWAANPAFAQGGPPYYTNDPGTPGPAAPEILQPQLSSPTLSQRCNLSHQQEANSTLRCLFRPLHREDHCPDHCS
jgi:hypothetical protein